MNTLFNDLIVFLLTCITIAVGAFVFVYGVVFLPVFLLCVFWWAQVVPEHEAEDEDLWEIDNDNEVSGYEVYEG